MRFIHFALFATVVVAVTDIAPAPAQFMRGMRGGMMMRPMTMPAPMQMPMMQSGSRPMMMPMTMPTMRTPGSMTPRMRNPNGTFMGNGMLNGGLNSLPLYGSGLSYPSYYPSSGYTASSSGSAYAPSGNSGSGYQNSLRNHDNGLTPEELALAAKNLFEHSLNDPSDAELTTGVALNRVLTALIPLRDQLTSFSPVSLPDGAIQRLRFATKAGGSTPAELIDGNGKILWPNALAALTDPSVVAVRSRIEDRVGEALSLAAAGVSVNAGAVKGLDMLTARLDELVSERARVLGFDGHREGKRFVRGLEGLVATFGKPGTAERLAATDTLAASTTVPELVMAMSNRSVRFAPAAPGSEAAYRATHHALVRTYRAATPEGTDRK